MVWLVCVGEMMWGTHVVEHVWIEETRRVDIWQGGWVAELGGGAGGDEQEVRESGRGGADDGEDEGEEEHLVHRLVYVVVVHRRVFWQWRYIVRRMK